MSSIGLAGVLPLSFAAILRPEAFSFVPPLAKKFAVGYLGLCAFGYVQGNLK